MRARRKPHRLVGAVVFSVALVGPAIAVAATGNNASISAPSRAVLHQAFKYSVSGNSAEGNRGLAVYLNTGLRCPKTVKKEAHTAFSSTGVFDTVLRPGHFKGRFSVTPAATGKHYICAYLYDKSSAKTLAHASHKYVTSRH